ncbi:hypothetical protein [Kitasatospora mediocidica]|uniref:hypothetical protein n=1 Tax=Kitasatospora mediocidica TaxID=58352 RepID=UPI00055FB26A|nr:hypothetical protein [Kitasatospora mediocidica]
MSITIPAAWRGRGQHRVTQTRSELLAIIAEQQRKLDAADELIKVQTCRLLDLGAEAGELRRAHREVADRLAAANARLDTEPDAEATQEIPIATIRPVPLWARPGGYGAAQVPQMAAPPGQAA